MLAFVLVKILSRDSVTVAVDAVVYYRVHNPTIAISNVENFRQVFVILDKALAERTIEAEGWPSFVTYSGLRLMARQPRQHEFTHSPGLS